MCTEAQPGSRVAGRPSRDKRQDSSMGEKKKRPLKQRKGVYVQTRKLYGGEGRRRRMEEV